MKKKSTKSLVKYFIAVSALIIGCIQVPKTTGQDPSIEHIVIDGYAFHTLELGEKEKPPLIIIHGGPGGDFKYLLSLRDLSSQYHVLYYDQRNTGLSTREKEINDTLPSTIKDLNSLVDFHGKGKPVILVGHSWGAMIAVGYIARYPDKVESAILMEPGMLDTNSAKYFVKTIKESNSIFTILKMFPAIIKIPFVKTYDGEERYDFVMTYSLNHGGGKPYQCEGAKLPDNSYQRAGFTVFNKMLKPVLDDPNLFTDKDSKGVEKFTKKLLLLSSECSFIGYDFQEKFHKKLFPPQTEHWLIKDTGHSMPVSKPLETLELILKFLFGKGNKK